MCLYLVDSESGSVFRSHLGETKIRDWPWISHMYDFGSRYGFGWCGAVDAATGPGAVLSAWTLELDVGFEIEAELDEVPVRFDLDIRKLD